MSRNSLLLLVLLAVVEGSPAAAQRVAPEGAGGWYGFGGGAAWARMDCGRCESLPDSIPYAGGTGFHLLAAGGWALSPRLLLGGMVSAYGRRVGHRDVALITLSGLAQFYPREGGREFLRVGVGPSASTLAGGGALVEVTGIAAHVEVGKDLRTRGRRAIVPYAGAMLASNFEGTGSVHFQAGREMELDLPRRPYAVYLGASLVWYPRTPAPRGP